MDRVAVHGWSYGGYLSLMALIKHPDIFKVSCYLLLLEPWLVCLASAIFKTVSSLLQLQQLDFDPLGYNSEDADLY